MLSTRCLDRPMGYLEEPQRSSQLPRPESAHTTGPDAGENRNRPVASGIARYRRQSS